MKKSSVGKTTCLPLVEDDDRILPSCVLSTVPFSLPLSFERQVCQAFHRHPGGKGEEGKTGAQCGKREEEQVCSIPQGPALRA